MTVVENTVELTDVCDLTGRAIDLSALRKWGATYYAVSVDPGSDTTTMCVQGVRVRGGETQLGTIYQLSIPSLVDTGHGLLAKIANVRRVSKGKPLTSCLRPDEFIIRFHGDKHESLVGKLAALEGKHPTDAMGDPTRYHGTHITTIVCAMLGAMIPDSHAVVRMNLCMPLSLFSPEAKDKAIANLSRFHRFYINESLREMDITVGTVIPEGYAAIALYGGEEGNYAALDIGGRTSDFVVTDGLTFVSNASEGRTYGIRQVIDEVIEEVRQDYDRILTVEEVRTLLKNYTAGQPLREFNSPKGKLTHEILHDILYRRIVLFAQVIAKFIRARLNQEGSVVGGHIEKFILFGGGAYCVYDILKNGVEGVAELEEPVFPNIILPPAAEFLNAIYCQKVVFSLPSDRWERTA